MSKKPKINKIAVLTSGGDSPGMNNAVYSIIRTAYNMGITPYVIYDGYKGMYNNDIHQIELADFEPFKNLGGTKIGSSRFPEFTKEEIRGDAIKNLQMHGIQAVVIIGGDGSYMGAKKLSDMGINTIGLPGTIDNNIPSSAFTIGFDSTLNYILEAIDSVRSTAESHHRCMIIEVMGQYCGDLALFSGIAGNVDLIITPNEKLSEDKIVQKAKAAFNAKKRSFVIVTAENIYPDIKAIAEKIKAKANYDARSIILGQVQRGLAPNFTDRFMTSLMGAKAVELLAQGKTSRCLGFYFNEIKDYDITKALALKEKDHSKILHVLNLLMNKQGEK